MRGTTSKQKLFIINILIFLFFCFFLASNTLAAPDGNIAPATISSPFHYYFRIDGILHETKWVDRSSSPYFWLTSGGKMILSSGTGKTIQGDLPALDKWRLEYALANPTDTDNGYHPQNIFRLVTRSMWKNFSQEIYFKINRNNLSPSPNRNASNGVLFFNRYIDYNNIYYTGLRVDGAAVIKKKIGGTYYTMAYKNLFPTSPPYNRNTNPNLLPKDTWIGMRSEIRDIPGNQVRIKLFVDIGKTGVWVPALEVVDNGRNFGGTVIGNEGYAGVRSDFMDIDFDDYQLIEL